MITKVILKYLRMFLIVFHYVIDKVPHIVSKHNTRLSFFRKNKLAATF